MDHRQTASRLLHATMVTHLVFGSAGYVMTAAIS
jgi:hypothetical protein